MVGLGVDAWVGSLSVFEVLAENFLDVSNALHHSGSEVFIALDNDDGWSCSDVVEDGVLVFGEISGAGAGATDLSFFRESRFEEG